MICRYFTSQYPPPLTSKVSPALCLVRSDIENLLSTTSSALVSQWNLTNQVFTWFLCVGQTGTLPARSSHGFFMCRAYWNLTSQVFTWFLYVWSILKPYQPGLHMISLCVEHTETLPARSSHDFFMCGAYWNLTSQVFTWFLCVGHTGTLPPGLYMVPMRGANWNLTSQVFTWFLYAWGIWNLSTMSVHVYGTYAWGILEPYQPGLPMVLYGWGRVIT